MRLSKVKQSRNNELSVLERETFGEERRFVNDPNNAPAVVQNELVFYVAIIYFRYRIRGLTLNIGYYTVYMHVHTCGQLLSKDQT